jgi:hypothetical protein
MFEVPEATAMRCTNANPRREFHGEDPHRAIDLTFALTGENTLLDVIAPGLRSHHYCNRAAEAAQASVPDVAIPLPNLRFPQLPTEIRWNQPKARGYRWIWDWGREQQHVDLSDAVLASLAYTLQEGGSVDVKFTVSYNGDELADNTLYGELCGMASMGDVHVQLLAPPDLVPVKKGWRSGKVDAPLASDGGGELFSEGPDEGNGESEEHPEGTPEAALAGAVAADKEAEAQAQARHAAAWPFPRDDRKADPDDHYPAPPAKRRGRNAAAA